MLSLRVSRGGKRAVGFARLERCVRRIGSSGDTPVKRNNRAREDRPAGGSPQAEAGVATAERGCSACLELMISQVFKRENDMWEKGPPSPNRGCPRGQRHPSLPPWPSGDSCLYWSPQQSNRHQAVSSHTYPGPVSPPSLAPGSAASHNCLLKISFPHPHLLISKYLVFRVFKMRAGGSSRPR